MEEQKELISVVIPVYNIEGYLPKCLETVSVQTYRNLEIILVDDGSTDSSGIICDHFAATDFRAKVIHQKNQGLWAARNTGQRAARGEFLMFVDGDDYLHIDVIRVMYTAINHNKCYDLAIVSYKKTNNLNEDIRSDDQGEISELSSDFLIHDIFIDKKLAISRIVWNKLYRKRLIDNIWARPYIRAQDFDYNFRVYLRLNNAIWVRRTLYFYVQRPSSLSYGKNAHFQEYTCRTKLLYDNVLLLPSNKNHYSYLPLSRLYRDMVIYKNMVWGKDNEKEVFSKCNYYMRNTQKEYWFNRYIPLYEKVGVSLLLLCPRFTRWIMILTKNA